MPFHFVHITSMTDGRSNDDQAVRELVERIVTRLLSSDGDNNNAEMLNSIAQLQRRIEEQDRRIHALETQLETQSNQSQIPASVEGRLNEVTRRLEARVTENEQQLRDYVREMVSAGDENGEQMERHRREFVYHGPRELDGIISVVVRECGGNVHEKGVVNVTASSYHEGRDI